MARLKRKELVVNSFYQLDKLLFISEKYKNTLTPTAKLVYAIFYDRCKLSEMKGFYDENQDVFFFFTVEKLMDILNCGKAKAIAIKKELVDISLLEEIRTGRTNKLYLHSLDTDSFSENEIQKFNVPDRDETIWQESEIKKRIESYK